MVDVPIQRAPTVGTAPVAVPRLGTPAPVPGGGGAGAVEIATQSAQNVAQFIAVEKQKGDQIAVQEGIVKATSASNEFMYGENGILKTQGSDAIGVPTRFNKDWKKQLRDIELSLASETQRQSFRLRTAKLNAGMENEMLKHVAVEGEKHDQNVLTATLASNREKVAANPFDQEAIDEAISGASGNNVALAEHALRVGMSPEELDLLVFEAESDIHMSVLQAMTDAGEDLEAKKYFETNAGRINQESQGKARRWLRETNLRQESQRFADNTFNSGISERDALNRAELEKDLEMRKRKEQAVRERYSEDRRLEAQEQQRLFDQGVSRAIANPGEFDINKVMTPQMMDDAGPTVRLKWEKMLSPPEDSNRVKFFEFSQFATESPAALAALTPGELLMRFAVDFNEADKERARTMWVAAKNRLTDPATWKRFTADEQAITDVLIRAELFPAPGARGFSGALKPTVEQLDRRHRVQSAFNFAVDMETGKQGRPLTPPERELILGKVVGQTAFLDGERVQFITVETDDVGRLTVSDREWSLVDELTKNDLRSDIIEAKLGEGSITDERMRRLFAAARHGLEDLYARILAGE
jgi:hypothetical protein